MDGTDSSVMDGGGHDRVTANGFNKSIKEFLFLFIKSPIKGWSQEVVYPPFCSGERAVLVHI